MSRAPPFGNGFNQGVNRNVMMQTVSMRFKPAFAHTSVDMRNNMQSVRFQRDQKAPRKTQRKVARGGRAVTRRRRRRKGRKRRSKHGRPPPPPRPAMRATEEEPELQEFNVAVFNGRDVNSLKQFLREGRADVQNWREGKYKDLLDDIKNGKCELGLDPNGNALRIATVAKIFIYDQPNDMLLYNPLNTFEEDDFVQERRAEQHKDMELMQKRIGGEISNTVTVPEDPANFIRRVEIPSNFVLQTSFSPFSEEPRDAAARVISWRFGLENVTGKTFSPIVPVKTTQYESMHYPGLKSEYHTHMCILKPQYIMPLQKVLDPAEVSPIILNEKTNTGVNCHWYMWITVTEQYKEIVKEIKELYDDDEKIQQIVGKVDFNGNLVDKMAKFLFEEAELLEYFA